MGLIRQKHFSAGYSRLYGGPPLASVAITVYEPAVVAVIEAVVAPVLQRYDVPPLAVKTTLPPEQNVVVVAAVIVAVGNALTVTDVAALAADVQPFASVTCTVGEDVVETVIEDVVAPVLQRYDVPALDVKTTLPPEQNVVVVAAVIVGVVGKALTVTDVAALAADFKTEKLRFTPKVISLTCVVVRTFQTRDS